MARAGRLLSLREIGLTLPLRHGNRSALVALACGLAFGVWMALADATVFRAAVPEVQHVLVMQMTLVQRLARFVPGALLDEVEYRLIALTAICWLLAGLTGRRGPALHWPSILLVAFVVYPLGAWGYFQQLHWSSLTVAREVVLHGGAGMLWGWLYCRHGWLAGVIGHIGAHLALQPLLGVMA